VQPDLSLFKTGAILYSINFGDLLSQMDLWENSISLDVASGCRYTFKFGEWISRC
jgi:hypothetical protein